MPSVQIRIRERDDKAGCGTHPAQPDNISHPTPNDWGREPGKPSNPGGTTDRLPINTKVACQDEKRLRARIVEEWVARRRPALVSVGWRSPLAQARDDAKDWSMYNPDVIGTRHNRGETAIDKSQCRPARREMAIPRQGLGAGDRRHPCHARRRGRLRLFRHGHGPDVLQADARRQGPLVLPQPGAERSGLGSRRSKTPRSTEERRFQSSRGGHLGLGAWSPTTPSSSATSAAGSTRSTERPGRSVGS